MAYLTCLLLTRLLTFRIITSDVHVRLGRSASPKMRFGNGA